MQGPSARVRSKPQPANCGFRPLPHAALPQTPAVSHPIFAPAPASSAARAAYPSSTYRRDTPLHASPRLCPLQHSADCVKKVKRTTHGISQTLRPPPRSVPLTQAFWDELQKRHFSLARRTGTHQSLRHKPPGPSPHNSKCLPASLPITARLACILLLLPPSGLDTLAYSSVPERPSALGRKPCRNPPGSDLTWELEPAGTVVPDHETGRHRNKLFLSSRRCT